MGRDEATIREYIRNGEAEDERLEQGTPQRVYGPVALPGKATAVVGMRRSDFLSARERSAIEHAFPDYLGGAGSPRRKDSRMRSG